MEKIPIISVVVPIYNGEKFIKEAIKSILRQTWTDWELLIVNDASTDQSGKIIEEYQKKDQRIKLITNQINEGNASSRNRGISDAKGKYIACFDADDIALPNRLRTQYEYLKKHRDIFLVAGSYISVNEHNQEIEKTIYNFKAEELTRKLVNYNIVHNPTVMWRNEQEYRYRNKFRAAADYDLWLRMLSDGRKMVVLPDILIRYRIHNQSITNKSFLLQKYFKQLARKYYWERKRLGKDSYESLDEKILIAITKEKMNGQVMVASRNLKIFFRNNQDMKKFRGQMRCFWKDYGLLVWPEGLIFYLASCLPSFFRGIFRDAIWKKI